MNDTDTTVAQEESQEQPVVFDSIKDLPKVEEQVDERTMEGRKKRQEMVDRHIEGIMKQTPKYARDSVRQQLLQKYTPFIYYGANTDNRS